MLVPPRRSEQRKRRRRRMKEKRRHQPWAGVAADDNGSAIGKDAVDTLRVDPEPSAVVVTGHALLRFYHHAIDARLGPNMTRQGIVRAIKDSVMFGDRSDRDPTLLDRLPIDRSRLKSNRGRPVTVFYLSGHPFVSIVTRMPDKDCLIVLTVLPIVCN